MSLKDQAADEARELMQRTSPACPACGAGAGWKYGTPELLNKHDTETAKFSTSIIVRIWCEECGNEMPHYEKK